MRAFEFSQEQEKENLEKKGKLTPELEESLDGKCGGCNWESDHLFVLAKTKSEAKKLLFKRYSGDGAGMCGECFSSFMTEYDFTFNKQTTKKGSV